MRTCERCGGERWIEVERGGVAMMERCGCYDRFLQRRRVRRAGGRLPQRFRGVGLDRNPVVRLPESQRRRLREFHDGLGRQLDAGRGLWIAGDSGVGKSAAAAVLVLRAEELGRSALFCEIPELLNTLRRTYREESRLDDETLYRDLEQVDLLVLDDMGTPRVSDWVLEQLFIVVNKRYKTSRGVLVTSDVSPEQLSKQIGWRTVRRLLDICGEPLTLSLEETAATA